MSDKILTDEEVNNIVLAVARALGVNGPFKESELIADGNKAIRWAESVRIGAVLLKGVIDGTFTLGFKGVSHEPDAVFSRVTDEQKANAPVVIEDAMELDS